MDIYETSQVKFFNTQAKCYLGEFHTVGKILQSEDDDTKNTD